MLLLFFCLVVLFVCLIVVVFVSTFVVFKIRDASRKMRKLESDLNETESRLRTAEVIVEESRARVRSERTRAMDANTSTKVLQDASFMMTQAKAKSYAVRLLLARQVHLFSELLGDVGSLISHADLNVMYLEQSRELYGSVSEVARLVGDDSTVVIAAFDGNGKNNTTVGPFVNTSDSGKLQLQQQRIVSLEADLAEAKSVASLEVVAKTEVERLYQIEKNRVVLLEKDLKATEDELNKYADHSVGAKAKIAALSKTALSVQQDLVADEAAGRLRDVELTEMGEKLKESEKQCGMARSDVYTALDAVSQWEQRYVAAAETSKRLREREDQALKKVSELQESLRDALQRAERSGSGSALVSLSSSLPTQVSSMCCLLSLDTRNPHVGLERGGGLTFGRDTDCTLVLTGKDISHHHARIFYEPEFDQEGITSDLLTPFVLEDTSANGVFCNFEKVGNGQRRRLRHGDALWFSKLSCKNPKSTNHAYVFQVSMNRKAIVVPPWDNIIKATPSK
jgi:hypothetical protein